MTVPEKENEGVEASSAEVEAWNDRGNEVELIIDDEKAPEEGVPEEFQSLSKAQIVAKLREVEAQKAAAPSARSDFDQLAESIDKMASRAAPAPLAPPVEPESWDKAKEKINEQFAMDPAEAATKLFTEKLSPMVAQSLMAVTDMARQLMLTDPEKGTTFKKYASEIDAEVAKQSPQVRMNPKIYEYAYKKVISDHVDEIIKEKVAQAVAEAVKPSTPQPAPHQEGRPGVSRPGKPQVRMATAEAARLRSIGVDPQDFAEANGGSR